MAKRLRRNISQTKWIGALIAAGFLLILIITFTSKKTNKRNPKQIIIGMSQEPSTLDPMFMQMAAEFEVYGLTFEDMIERDENWDLHPRLVKDIPTLENGGAKLLPGGKIQVTWRFKDGIRWADGTPITPQDFIFNHEMTMDDRVPVVSRDFDRRIEKMTAVDDKTLVVLWKEPYAYYWTGHAATPKHIVEPVYRKDPAKYAESEFNQKPFGNGAYELETWVSGSHLIYRKNPNWVGEDPYFEKIIYKVITNTNALESNLVSGTIDAISPLGLSLDQQLDFERRYGNKFKFYYKPALVWEHIDFNLDAPLLKDKRVRQALLYGANRQKIVDTLFQGKQQVADNWLPPKHYAYNPTAKHYPYDPKKAEELLDEAGWVKTPQGVRVNRFGQKLRLEFMTTAENKTREQTQQILQSDWRNLGIEIEIVNQPGKVFFGETMKKRKFKHLALYAWGMSPISDGEGLWTQENIPSEKNNWQGQNNPGWYHPRAYEIDHKVAVTLDEKKRVELLQEEQNIWADELPALPLFFRSELSVTRSDLQEWKVTGSTTPVTWNAELWRYARAQ